MSKNPRDRCNPGWFSKGRSGNPKGRPKGSRVPTASELEVLAEMTLKVPYRGGTREITAEEAIQQRIFQDALEGKRMAVREVMKWIMEREAWRAQQPEAFPSVAVHVAHDPKNADAALMLLGIAAPPDPSRAGWARLSLEPWAVQAALRRRRGGQRLTEQQLDSLGLCIRDPDTVRWPRGTGR
jgi:Family of unknown function (DUF5681)